VGIFRIEHEGVVDWVVKSRGVIGDGGVGEDV
jgi:hypothetical protein